MSSIHKYYKLAALLPLGLTTVLGIILSITHDGSKYKSEWFTDDGFLLTVFLTILLSGFISLLSLTIFLNKKPAIKVNTIFSFILWVALPGAVSAYVIYQEFLNFSGYSDIDGVYEGNRLIDGYIMSMAIMHLLGLIATFLHYFYFSSHPTYQEKNKKMRPTHLIVTTYREKEFVQCNYCQKSIAHFLNDEMVPSPEECYKNGNVPVPNFGWFCSQDCAINYEKENDIQFARNSFNKIDYYTK